MISGLADDGTAHQAERLSTGFRLRVIREPRPGRAAACNTGIAAAEGEVLVLMDDDMEPAPALLAAHLDAQRLGRRRGIVGAVPVVLKPSSPPVAAYVAAKFERHLAALGSPGYRFKLRDFYSGNFSIRREVLRECGGFDEQFTIYGNEDLELSLRLTARGVELVFCPEALAWQHYEKDFAALAGDTVAKGRTAVLFTRKHPQAYQHLKLATYEHGSRKRRGVRAVLLASTRIWPGTPTAIVAAVRRLERTRARRLHRYYAVALDFFYWLGASTAAREPDAQGMR